MVSSSIIWVDKYRPKNFSEIIGQDFFVKRISSFIKSGNLPHMLFAGNAGTGKTTTALVVAKEIFNKEVQGNFLELNASDDRGIDIIRNQIKEFAKLKSLTNSNFKIICLDEADSLTKDAQQALRRTMEKYSFSCRFILSCNNISKIIDPIQSRCVIFKFKPLKDADLSILVNRIKEKEKLILEDGVDKLLINTSKGDVRRLINLMQTGSAISKKISKESILEVIDFINPKDVEKMIDFAINGEFLKARDLMVRLRVFKGLDAVEILKEIFKVVISSKTINDKIKIKLVDRIALCEFRIVEGSDEQIQLDALLSVFALI